MAAASRSASLVLPMPPGPHRVSCLTRRSMTLSSARSRSRPMKLFSSAGRLPRFPAVGVMSDVMGCQGAQDVFRPLWHHRASPSADDLDPDGLAVPQAAEVHDLDQCPPPLARARVGGDSDTEGQRHAV